MATNYLTKLNNDLRSSESVTFTAAEQPHIDDFKQQLDRTVQQGHSPQTLLNMTYLLALLQNRGVSVDTLEHQVELIMFLGFKNNFQFQDCVIDAIVNEVKQAEQEHRVFDRNLIHTIQF